MDNLTVVIPFRNGHATIGRLLDSIPAGVPIIVADDMSDKPLQSNRARVIRLGSRGYFSGAVNVGINACQTDVLIVNQDAWFDGPQAFDQVEKWQSEQYAIAGDGVMKHPAWPKGYVQGTCMYMQRAAIQRVGLLDEQNYPLWGATCDWQLRACRAGFTAHPCAVEFFHHHEKRGNQPGSSITAALNAEPDKRDLFIRTPPAISIIIPCYCYGKYLSDAIASLIGGESSLGVCPPQTFQSFEVIIVDDASPDNSFDVAQSLADGWKAIRAIRNAKNVGTAATINAGIKQAFGKYITILSADDMMSPSRLGELYQLAQANAHSVIYDDIRIFKNGKLDETLALPDYSFDKVLYKNCMHCGIFYPRQAWQECNGYPEVMRDGREDWAFNVALGAKGYCGVHLKRPLYLYRREGHNRSVRNSSGNWYETYRARLRALYPNLYAGERPSMCCGAKSKKVLPTVKGASRKVAAAATAPIGAAGMTLLEYLGGKGPQPYFSREEPQQTYVYGGKHHFIYVDNRHVPEFLAMMEGRKMAFKKGQLPAPHLPPEDKKPVEPPVEESIDVAPVVEVSEPEIEEAPKKRGRKAKAESETE